MAASRDTTAKNIKPLNGAIIRRYTTGEAVAAGEIVAMNTSGVVVAAETDDITEAVVMGIAIAAAASGARVEVVIHGPVVCLSGATIGAYIYATDTAGEPGESAGTKSAIVGISESATVLFVRPHMVHYA